MASFEDIFAAVRDLLQREQRISYRALKRRFELNEEDLEDLKEELIFGKRIAVEEDGRVLVWTGGETVEATADTRSAPPLSAQSKAQTPFGERRQLTVMFCDLVGSTALSGQLDPEDLQTVVRGFQEVSAQVIERYEGYIAQYLGDGLLVYFGYPAAHEDDAARSIRAGLEILAALAQASDRFPQPVQVRIGIHTGPVVVGQMGGGSRREQLALGETPNIAARVQGVAAPDTVVITAATQQLVTGLFETTDRGVSELQGVSTPQSLYGVTAESVAQSRFEVAVRSGLAPLVGRESELAALTERWTRARAGEGNVVLLSGEPGIGKSRLVEAFKARVVDAGAIPIEFRCSPYHRNSALYPITEHLRRLLQWAPEDTPETKLDKLQRTLSRYRFPGADTLPLLAALLSLPHPDGVPPVSASPQKQKESTQAALVAWLLEESERAGLFSVWEDLHWADPSTLDLLDLFIARVPNSSCLALLTFRPEFVPPWATSSYLHHLTIGRIDQAQANALVERVTGGKPLPEDVVEQILTKTDGVPLFVEELTKMVMESGLVRAVNGHYELTGSLPPLAIPSTLQDSLMARLDRIGEARDLAQLGATLGREFRYALLHAVSPLDEAALQQGLQHLVDSELLYQRGLPPDASYLFKHALIQDTAYASLLKSRRQQLHQQVAEVLEQQFVETVETQPELLAHHYTEACLSERAIPYWQQAGLRAVMRSANAEAFHHLTQGLELLQTLPATPERLQQELSLQVALSTPLTLTKGYAAPELRTLYTRAEALCRQIGETPQLFPVLLGLWRFYVVRAEYGTARDLGGQLLRLGESTGDQAFLLGAHNALGVTHFYMGELEAAQAHMEQALAHYDPQQHHPLHSQMFRAGQDPGVACEVHAAWSLWLRGYPDQARERIHHVFSLVEGMSHPFSVAYGLLFTAILLQQYGETEIVHARAEAGIRIARDNGFALLIAHGSCLQGWANTQNGKDPGEVLPVQQGRATAKAIGVELGHSFYSALLCDSWAKAGQPAEGLAVLDELLESPTRREEHFFDAELYRLRGALMLQAKARPERSQESQELVPGTEFVRDAEGCFQQAIDIAQQQHAKSLELRAATSLARLWQGQGKQEEARRLLAPVYDWFTEGIETADLQDAKALLDDLDAHR